MTTTNENDQLAGQPDDEDDFEWGGDGSDLNLPVRAHVEAALVPTGGDYPPPLDQLLRVGSPLDRVDTAARIARIGLGQEHVPDLVRMTRDRALNTALSDADEGWAPIHALTALEKLDVGAYAADLVPLFDVDSEWFGENLPEVLGRAGEPALEPLRQYMQDTTRWVWGRAYATSTFPKLVQQYPELRDQAVQILSDALARPGENDPVVNADLVLALVKLHAVESLPLIRQAFEQDLVDESVMGGWDRVLRALGQQPDPDDPLVQPSRERWGDQQAELHTAFQPGLRQPQISAPAPAAPKKNKAAQQKNKRKMSAASRKTNKKKRK
ncbi:MAG TPA: DUF1186 domain-containing protein [Roseiflexaceae bacterium]